MLWLAIDLTHLPLDALAAPSERPCGVCESGQLLSLNAAAAARGLQPGQRLGSALALVPELHSLPRDCGAESRALEGLAAWAQQFTSRVSLDPPRHLLLDIGGSLKLFGGAAPLLARVRDGLQALGYGHRLAAAPTPLAARLLARCRPGGLLTRSADLRRELSAEPVTRLELPGPVLDQLQAVGIRALGECLDLPRAGLRRRYGAGAQRYLEALLGLAPDPRPGFRPPVVWHRRLELMGETERSEALLFGYRRLLLELEGYLRGADRGVQRLELRLEHGVDAATELSLGLARPGRDAEHWLGLLRERFERTPLDAPVRAIALAARDLAEFAAPQARLLPGQDPGARQRLLERLAARLGPGALYSLQSHADHRPERATQRCDPGAGQDLTGDRRPRPLWLLPEPEPVDPARLQIRTAAERLETGWWDGADARRDYHHARDGQGRELWVFRNHHDPGQWFVHGIFG